MQQHSLFWVRFYYILKFPATTLFGVIVTASLFYLMQYLIDSGENALNEAPNLRFVEFVRMKEDRQVEVKKRKPEPPPSPDEPPPEIRQQTDMVSIDNAWSANMKAPLANVDMSRSAAFASDGEYLPILKVHPVYPRLALQKGWFGWVMLEFTVNNAGKVVDPIVIENCVQTYFPGRFECVDRPGRIFDRPAMAAASKFKYKPRIVDGVAIDTSGVYHKITFELAEMREDQEG